MKLSERISTGIKELDEILGGGFYRGSIVLLAGNPGTGKTIFASQFLYSGLKKGEKCVYLSFAEDLNGYLFRMKRLGLDFEPFLKSGKFIFIPAPTVVSEDSVKGLVEELIELLYENNIKRVVIDPITAILDIVSLEKSRSLFHSGLIKALKSLGITGIFIADLPYSTETIGFEEFLVDTVIIMRMQIEKGLSRRIMEIRKTRFFAMDYISFEYAITDRGIRLYLPYLYEMKGCYSTGERLSTGLKELDEMLGGGLLKGSSILIFGPSGSGKTYISSLVALENAAKNNNVMYISFDEPREQLLNFMKSISKWKGVEEKIEVYSISPALFTLSNLYYYISNLISEKKPDLIILDGLTSLKRIFGKDFLGFSRMFIMYSKKLRSTLILTDMTSKTLEDELSNMVDTVIMISLDITEDSVKRRIAVLKNRGSWHENSVKELVFGKEGVMIK